MISCSKIWGEWSSWWDISLCTDNTTLDFQIAYGAYNKVKSCAGDMPEHPIKMKTDHFCAPSISKWYYSQCHRWNVFFVCLFFVFFFPPSSNYQQHMKKHELMHHLVYNGDMKVDWNGASLTILPDFIRNQSEQWWCPCFIAITSWNHHLLTYWYFKIKNKLNSTASLNYVVQIWHKMSGDVARPSWVEPRACGSVKQAQDFHPGDPCAVHVPC